MPMRVVTLRRWEVVVAFVALTIAFVVAIVWMTHQQHQLARQQHQLAHIADQNHTLILAQQASRLHSCRATYEGVREVLQPFLIHPRTAQRRRDIAKFNHSVNSLKARCPAQTQPKESK